MSKVFVVLKNCDFTEGHGPMVFHKVFTNRDTAENYIKAQSGIYGSPQYDKPNIYNHSIEAWNGYHLISTELE